MISRSHLPFDNVDTWRVARTQLRMPLSAHSVKVGLMWTDKASMWHSRTPAGSTSEEIWVKFNSAFKSLQGTCTQSQITPFCPEVDLLIGWIKLSVRLIEGLLLLWIVCGRWPNIIASLIPDLGGRSAASQLWAFWGFWGPHLTLWPLVAEPAGESGIKECQNESFWGVS